MAEEGKAVMGIGSFARLSLLGWMRRLLGFLLFLRVSLGF